MAFKMTGWSAFTKPDGKKKWWKREKSFDTDTETKKHVSTSGTGAISDPEKKLGKTYSRGASRVGWTDKKLQDIKLKKATGVVVHGAKQHSYGHIGSTEAGKKLKDIASKELKEKEEQGKGRSYTTDVNISASKTDKVTKKKKHKKKEFVKHQDTSSSATLGDVSYNLDTDTFTTTASEKKADATPKYHMTKTKKSGKVKTKAITEKRYLRKKKKADKKK